MSPCIMGFRGNIPDLLMGVGQVALAWNEDSAGPRMSPSSGNICEGTCKERERDRDREGEKQGQL